MNTRRLRMVAGPNGSGKSTLLGDLKGRDLGLGRLLNPDEIEQELQRHGRLRLATWGVEADDAKVRAFISTHALGAQVSQRSFSVLDNVLIVGPSFEPGYFTAVLSDFIRRAWLARGETFTFETVMSSRDKVQLLKEARDQGYRTYLYYVCTDSPLINRERVASRVASGGHDVPSEKIDSRYRRSLSLLPEAIRLSTRAFLFDNSARPHRLIAEFEVAKFVAAAANLPEWFVKSVLPYRDFAGL